MRSIITNWLLFCISAMAYSQKTDVEQDKLKGKVKSVTITRFTQDPGEERRFSTNSFTSYNENGFMLEYSGFESEIGPKDFIIIPCYDQQGHRNLDSSFKEGYVYDGKTSYVFDKSGNRVGEVEYNSYDTVVMRRSFKYNSKNQIIKQLIFKPDDLLGTIEYSVNTKGRDLSIKYTDWKGIVLYQYSFIYDIKGNTISEHYKNLDRKIEYLLKMKYDNYGNAVLEEKYDGKGMLEEKKTIEYKYDKYNNWIDKSAIVTRYYDKSSYEIYEMEYREIRYY